MKTKGIGLTIVLLLLLYMASVTSWTPLQAQQLPTDIPTNTPTNTPTDTPTNTPTNTPTHTPTTMPPTSTPTAIPTVPTGGYIQINNGVIVTNPNQHPQVVVQFGNRGNRRIENVAVRCTFDSDLGSLGAVYPGPFISVLSGSNSVSVGIGDGVDLPPGQNYNVAFNIHITAGSGATGSVSCELLSNSAVIAQTQAQVIVQ
jgi:hypothetical protein